MTNEELQCIRIYGLLQNDINLHKESLGINSSLRISKEYDINKILNNIKGNLFPYLASCLEILLKDKFVDRSVLYNNLLNYKYVDDNSRYKVDPDDDNEYIQGKVGFYDIDIFNDEVKPYIYLSNADKENFSVAVHEMYHFAALRNQSDQGLAYWSNGVGLDEGFTQYLTNIACNDGKHVYDTDNKYNVSYTFATSYMESFVELFGLDKMKEFYFNKGLNGFIDELNNYTEEEDTLTFISNLDYICSNEIQPKKEYDVYEFYDKVNECNGYLADLWYKLKPGEDMSEYYLVGINEELNNDYLFTNQVGDEMNTLLNKK